MISSETTRIEYTGNGATTAFPYPFKILNQSHLAVYKNGVLQTLTTHYTVSGVGGASGGNVTFVTAPANGDVLVILRDVPMLQLTDYIENGPFPAETHEAALDYLTMLIQQLYEQWGRSLQLGVGGTVRDIILDPPGAGQYLRYSANGLRVEPAGTSVVELGNYLGSGAGAVSRSVTSKLGDFVSVKDFGAVGNGTTDDTVAIQAGIDYIESLGGGVLWFPHATYKTTGTLTVASDRVNLWGAGKQASILLFTPGSNNKACLHFSKGASVLFQASVRGIGIQNGGAATGKIGILAEDTSELMLDHVAVLMETTNASIGIKLHGREFTSLRDVETRACSPLYIGNNPNTTIDCDHLSVHNFYGLAPAGSFDIITVEDGSNLTNLEFSGYQSWVGGRDGFRFISSGAAADLNLCFRNVRREQESGGFMFRFERTTGFPTGVVFDNCEGGTTGDGWKLRNCRNVTIRDCRWLRAGGTSLDADNTNLRIVLQNFFRQTGSTLTIGAGLISVFRLGGDETGNGTDLLTIYDVPSSTTKIGPTIFAPGGVSYTPNGRIHTNTTAQATTGTSEETLATYTLPAGTLNVNNRAVRIRASFTKAANVNSVTARIRWNGAGGTSVATQVTAVNAAGIVLEAVITRTGASAQDYDGKGFSNGGTVGVNVGSDTVALSGAIDILIRGTTASGAGDLTFEKLEVDLEGP